MDTYLPDISVFQASADISGIRQKTGAIAARILYGTTIDKEMPGRLIQIRQHKFDAVIYYIFMRSAVSALSQYTAVVDLIPNLVPGEAVCVDWEADVDKSVPAPVMRDTFLSLLDNYYSQSTILYGSGSSLSTYTGNRPAWVAAYGRQEPTSQHFLWQYTDGKNYGGPAPINWPGVGPCDTSIFHGTSQQLAEIIHPGSHHMQLNKPITDAAVTKSGNGYYLVGGDGGVFAFGDAVNYGNATNLTLAEPIVSILLTASGAGYWLVGADGGIFSYGDAVGHGNIPGLA